MEVSQPKGVDIIEASRVGHPKGSLYIMCHNKTKQPADLSIVKRLGGFSWGKYTALIWNSQTFLKKKAVSTSF